MIETRKARRFDCQEPVDCEIRGRLLMANLTDISITGGRLQGHELPEVGSLIRLAPAFGEGMRHWVYAQVCWIRRGEVEEAGLRFLEPTSRLRRSWIAELCQGEPERRSSIRVATEVHLELKIAGVRRPLEATSLDLSHGGAQALLPGVVRPGTRAEVTLCLPWAVVDIPAQVVRQADLESANHCLRFLDMPHQDAVVLDSYLRDELVTQKSQSAPDLFLLDLFNRRV